MNTMDPRDYIDSDERIDPREPFFTEALPCENCGCPCHSRVWVPGFEYWACDDCALEASILIYAESNCETLYGQILRAKSIAQVQAAYRAHQETCPACIRKRREQQRAEHQREREAA